jgi:hypothetical protein
MSEGQWGVLYAFGGLLLVSLLFFAMPGLYEPVGFLIALIICYHMAYRHWPTEIKIALEKRKIDREHEAL